MVKQTPNSIVRSNGNAAPLVSRPAPVSSQTIRRQDSLIEILWRQRRIVGIAVGIGFVLGLIYIAVASRQYTSTSRLYVTRGAKSLLTESHSAPASDDDNFLTTQREVIASTPVLALTLATPGVYDLKTFDGQDRFDLLKKKLNVEVGKKVDLLSVSFEGKYPDEASTIVNAVVKAYSKYQTNQRQVANDEATATLNVDRAKWEGDLSKKNTELLTFQTSNGIVANGSDPTLTTDQRLKAINDALIAAHLQTVNAKIEYDQAARVLQLNPDLARQVGNASLLDETNASPEDLAALKQELSMAKARARELQRQYLPGHPAVVAAMKRVEQLTVEQTTALKVELISAQGKESDLQKLYAAEQKAALEQNAANAQCSRLQADIARLQSMVDSVDRRTREINLTSDDSAVSISILEPAHTDDHPTKPQKLTSLAMAMVLGLMFGAGGGFVRDRFDRRISSAADVHSLLGLNVLSRLPGMPMEMSPSDRAQQASLSPESELASACRILCNALLYAEHGEVPKTILVASPVSGDGRSTLASNLAITLAEMGKRVLLIDADLRSPMQDWIFGIEKSGGLVGAITHYEQSGSQLPTGMHRSSVARLDVLPAGHVVADPPRLLNAPSFGPMLENLADVYDHVIVDSPAISSGPDARVLAAHCDASLLVLREGQTSLREAEQAMLSLHSVATKVAGVVLNQLAVSTTSHGYSWPAVRNNGVMAQRLAPVQTIGARDVDRLGGFVNMNGVK